LIPGTIHEYRYPARVRFLPPPSDFQAVFDQYVPTDEFFMGGVDLAFDIRR
jgi:hypothetical protein